jgi:hypothetical protein
MRTKRANITEKRRENLLRRSKTYWYIFNGNRRKKGLPKVTYEEYMEKYYKEKELEEYVIPVNNLYGDTTLLVELANRLKEALHDKETYKHIRKELKIKYLRRHKGPNEYPSLLTLKRVANTPTLSYIFTKEEYEIALAKLKLTRKMLFESNNWEVVNYEISKKHSKSYPEVL